MPTPVRRMGIVYCPHWGSTEPNFRAFCRVDGVGTDGLKDGSVP